MSNAYQWRLKAPFYELSDHNDSVPEIFICVGL